MSKKDEDTKRRKAQKKQQAQRKEQVRSAKFEQNGKTMLLRQGGGYNVEMIRDFFDHLMLELKNRRDEAEVLLQSLEEGDPWRFAYSKSQKITSPVDDELYSKYLGKYRCALLATNSINTEGASDEEIAMFLKAHRTSQIDTCDKMMACLQELEPQLDEALLCAKYPYSPMADGGMAAPTREFRVLDQIDDVRRAIEAEKDRLANPGEYEPEEDDNEA